MFLFYNYILIKKNSIIIFIDHANNVDYGIPIPLLDCFNYTINSSIFLESKNAPYTFYVVGGIIVLSC